MSAVGCAPLAHLLGDLDGVIDLDAEIPRRRLSRGPRAPRRCQRFTHACESKVPHALRGRARDVLNNARTNFYEPLTDGGAWRQVQTGIAAERKNVDP